MVILSFAEASVMRQPFKRKKRIRLLVFFFLLVFVVVVVVREMGCVVSLMHALSKLKIKIGQLDVFEIIRVRYQCVLNTVKP